MLLILNFINLLATIYKMMNSSDETPLLETTNKVLHMDTCGVHRQFLFRLFSFCHGHQNMLSLFEKENKKDAETVLCLNDDDTPFQEITLKFEDSRKYLNELIQWNTNDSNIEGDEVSQITNDTTFGHSTRSESGEKSTGSIKNDTSLGQSTRSESGEKSTGSSKVNKSKDMKDELEDTESDTSNEEEIVKTKGKSKTVGKEPRNDMKTVNA